MTIQELQSLIDSGEFHHATDKPANGLWSGLHIYRRAENGFNGFEHAGVFSSRADLGGNIDDYNAAYQLVRASGVSVGAYGRG